MLSRVASAFAAMITFHIGHLPLRLQAPAFVLVLALLGGPSLAAGTAGESALPRVPLMTLEGAPVDLPAFAKGQPTVVNLWATWCPPCREEMPMLALAQERETSVRFVFANQGESAAVVRRYLYDEILALDNVLLDAASALRPAVGARGLPTTLFYDAEGRLVARHVGAISKAALASKLKLLRPGD
ncbi:MAG: TlpA family protein disulfide reductase [Methylibium sp.]|nr:TlpA family protein disulfide reductase [Methylibium sp.]